MEQKWIDFLDRFGVSESNIEKARKFNTPQEAWDAWDNGADMLSIPYYFGLHEDKLILCACEIIERAMYLFENRHPDDKRPREALEAARRYAQDMNNKENYVAACVAARAAHSSLCKAQYRTLSEKHIANACWSVCAVEYTSSDVAFVLHEVVFAHKYALEDNPAEHTAEFEQKAQAEIVRKYFPVNPVLELPDNPFKD